jgi:hypothetical protein
MGIEFIEEAPDAVYPKHDNMCFEWKDGRKIFMPLAECVVAVRRTNVALDRWHEGEQGKIVPIRRRKGP